MNAIAEYVTTDFDEIVSYALSLDRVLTADEVSTAMSRVGRNDSPAMLLDLLNARVVPMDAFPGFVVDAWSTAEYPELFLPRRVWVDWFRVADFPRPSEPLTLYRGAIPRYARRMAWTTDLGLAQWFAHRLPHLGPGYVYTVSAPPEAILCDVDAIEGDGGRREAEIVVDPSELPRLRRVSDS